MIIFTLIGYSLALFYAAFWLGGVNAPDWNVSVATIGAVGLLFAIFARSSSSLPSLRMAVWLLCAGFFAIAIFQLVPLPGSLIAILSPLRKEMLDAAARLTPLPARSPLSAVPAATTDALIQFAAYFSVLIVIRQVAGRMRKNVWWCTVPLIVLAVAQAGLAMFQYYAGDGTARGTYVNYDHFAGLMEMVLPLPVMWAAEIWMTRRTDAGHGVGPAVAICALLTTAAIVLVGMIHSLSRMGFIASLTGLFALGIAAALTARRFQRSRRWMPIGVLSIVFVLAAIFLPVDPLIGRFGALADETMSEDTRVQIWRDTMQLIRDYPLTGCGLGAFESCFIRYKTVVPTLIVDFAHNDYLQLAAEVGLPAFLLAIALAIFAVIEILRASYGEFRYLALGCFGAVIAMGAHSVADFNMHIPSNAMVMAWILGLGAFCSASRRGASSDRVSNRSSNL